MLETVEVNKLENLWLKRQRKIILKYSLFCLALLGVILLAVFASFGSAKQEIAKVEEKSKIEEQVKIEQIEQKTEPTKKQEEQEKQEKIAAQIAKENTDTQDKMIKDIEALKEKVKNIKNEERMARNVGIPNGIPNQGIPPQMDMSAYVNPYGNAYAQNAYNDVDPYMARDFGYQQMPQQMPAQNIPPQARQAIPPQNTAPQQNYNYAQNNYNIYPEQKKQPGRIKISSSKDPASEMKNLESSFEERKDAKIALELAKKYYNNADYQKAAKYAFELNTLDKNDPNGWILFAKAKYNAGNTSDAIRVLEAFKSKAGNKFEVEELISQMQANAKIR